MRLGFVASLLAIAAGVMCIGLHSAEAAPGLVAQKAPKKRPPKPRPGKPLPIVAGPAPLAPLPEPSTPSRPTTAPQLAIERASLENGLRVVFAPDPKASSVAVAMAYDVGSRNEERGAAGLARLVEGLMARGSANVPGGEHERLIDGRGGTTASRTSNDMTTFVDVAPSGELPLLLWLEADRLKSLQITAEAFTAQRDLLLSLRERELDRSPLSRGKARLRELVFEGSYPLEHDPFGLRGDVAQLRAEAARAFYEAHYAPNNAVLAIVGDFDRERALSLVHRFFETARRQEKVTPFVMAQPAEQTSPRGASLEGEGTSSLLVGWSAPGGRSDDRYALSIALDVLADRTQGRLAARLARERGLASQVTALHEPQRGADLRGLAITLTDESARPEVIKLLDAELDALSKAGPTDDEMARARAHAEESAWRSLSRLDERALAVASFELVHGDASLLSAEQNRLSSVTRERVRLAVGRHLSPSRRTVVDLVSPSKKPVAARPVAPAWVPPKGRPPPRPPRHKR